MKGLLSCRQKMVMQLPTNRGFHVIPLSLRLMFHSISKTSHLLYTYLRHRIAHKAMNLLRDSGNPQSYNTKYLMESHKVNFVTPNSRSVSCIGPISWQLRTSNIPGHLVSSLLVPTSLSSMPSFFRSLYRTHGFCTLNVPAHNHV